MQGIKVLHTGDFHLSNGSTGSVNGKSLILSVFDDIIEYCNREYIDILLIAGDMFDEDRPFTQVYKHVRGGFAQLTHTIVVISPGNHDPLNEQSPYNDMNNWSENVYIFAHEMDYYEFDINGQCVRIYGAAFEKRYENQTLFNMGKVSHDNVINIGLIHGEIVSRQGKSQYNPITIQQIENSGLDYLAVGHIHKRSLIKHVGRTAYAYAGIPQGRGYDEEGIMGVYAGYISNIENNMHFVKMCHEIYLSVNYEIKPNEDINQIATNIKELAAEKYNQTKYEDINDKISIHEMMNEIDDEDKLSVRLKVTVSGENINHIDIKRLKHLLNEYCNVELIDNTSSVYGKTKETGGKVLGNSEDVWIKSLEIGSFGGLKDFSLNFSDGYQEIFGKNEWGKTTVMAFISMMLYGGNSKSKDLNVNTRKKYEPIDGSRMFGNMTICVANESYLISKKFGKSFGTDEVSVINSDTGEVVLLGREEEVGAHFLGIDKDIFEKTVFVGHNELWKMQDNIKTSGNKKFENLIYSGNEDYLQLESIAAQMENLRSKSGKNGEIAEISSLIEELRNEKNRLKEEYQMLKEEYMDSTDMAESELEMVNEFMECMEDGELKESDAISSIDKFSILVTIIGLLVSGLSMTSAHYLGDNKNMTFCMIILCGCFLAYDIIQILRKMFRRKETIAKYSGYSVAELKQRSRKLEKILNAKESNKISMLESKIQKYNDKINQLIEEREELTDRYGKLAKEYDIIKKHVNTDNKENVYEISDSALMIFNKISGERYDMFKLSSDYGVSVRRHGNKADMEWKQLSGATASQAYLSLRLAVCEYIKKENGITLPLFLDDILNIYDEERLMNTIQYLRKENRQVILFTCRRIPWNS